jgi:outer membrane protein OmpA-like peptidoglycan-associated protein
LRLNGLLEDTANVTGRVGTTAAMANVLYDFDLSRFGLPGTPYVGAGAGYGFRQYDDVQGNEPLQLTLPQNNIARGQGVTTRVGTYGQVAFQAIGGVAVPLPFLPGFMLTAEYRFFVMEHTRFGSVAYISTANTINGALPTERGHGYDDGQNHSVLIGLRYAFPSPPPPPAAPIAPAPAQVASRTYLVFFDWDRADLTERARQIVAEAAQATTRVQLTRIELNGYTDRSGTPAYNEGLSLRRAQTVAAELVRLGVPPASIAVRGLGESHPLVPTAAGVREPQNRRVEIILR